MTPLQRHRIAKKRRIGAGLLAVALLATNVSAASSSLGGTPEVQPAPQERSREGSPEALDPFLAGALGIVPFASGMYLTDEPARGILFTAVDVLMALGIYSARYTSVGEEQNVKTYFLLMGANNVLDAFVSMRYAARTQPLQAMLLPLPQGGIQLSLRRSF